MKSFISAFAMTLLLLSNAIMAQDFVFKVLANKGQNTYKSSASTEWEPLKTGAVLKNGDQVKTADGAYLGLYHASGRTVELKESGTHEIDKLAAGVNTGKASATSKYADFVMSKMSESKEDAHANYRKSMSTTGAVDRALASNAAIKLMAQSSSDVVNTEVILRWNDVETDNPEEKLTYKVTFMNLFDEEIAEEKTTKTYVKLDLGKKEFQGMDNKFVKIKIGVEGYDLVSDEYVVTIKPEDEVKELKTELSTLQEEIEEETAMSKLVMAAFYEENNLLLDALTCYELAIKIEPEVEHFQDAYELFLIRNGFAN